MHKQYDEYEQDENTGQGLKGFLVGTLVGGLIGATAMLLMAPQSGQKTRAKIQRAGLELREQTVTGLEDAVAQTRAKANEITTGVREKAEKIQQRGQEMLDQQKERWTPVVEAGQKAVQGNGA